MSSDTLVWYAGYGSNLLPRRFHAYMTGGATPNSPAGRIEIGARDTTLPQAEWCGEVDLPVVFAGRSAKWGDGAVAFADPSRLGTGSALVRAYLVTVEQLEDLHRQESRADAPAPTDIDELCAAGRLRLHEGPYAELIVGATHADGRPVVIIGSEAIPALGPPDTSYLRTMAEGLSTGFDLDADGVVRYLCGLDGARGVLDHATVRERCRDLLR